MGTLGGKGLKVYPSIIGTLHNCNKKKREEEGAVPQQD